MTWPVAGNIVSPFGASSRPNHRGIDLASRPAALVVAAIPGSVSFVGKIPGYGNVITISHDDHLTTVYAQLGETFVKEGQRVAGGEGIGRISSSGYLHYEVRRAKEAIDPATFYAVAPRPLPGGSERPADVSAEPVLEVPLGATTARGSTLPAGPSKAASPAPPKPARAARAQAASSKPAPKTPGTEASSTVAAAPAAPGMLGGKTRTGTARETGGGFRRSMTAVAEGAGLMLSNLFYVPAKLTYASAGAVTGGFVLVMAHDTGVATDVWSQTMGGDYVVLPSHIRGERSLHFSGRSPKAEQHAVVAPVATPRSPTQPQDG